MNTTVIIDYDEYKRLLDIEKAFTTNGLFIDYAFGGVRVYTKDEATKKLLEQFKRASYDVSRIASRVNKLSRKKRIKGSELHELLLGGLNDE